MSVLALMLAACGVDRSSPEESEATMTSYKAIQKFNAGELTTNDFYEIPAITFQEIYVSARSSLILLGARGKEENSYTRTFDLDLTDQPIQGDGFQIHEASANNNTGQRSGDDFYFHGGYSYAYKTDDGQECQYTASFDVRPKGWEDLGRGEMYANPHKYKAVGEPFDFNIECTDSDGNKTLDLTGGEAAKEGLKIMDAMSEEATKRNPPRGPSYFAR